MLCLRAEPTDTTSIQRGKITPVDIDRERPQQPVLHYYDRHGNPLAEPVRFYITADTVATPKISSPYPLYNGINVGVNVFDAVMLLAGQKHASLDIWAAVSLHNWFFPIVEAGVGFAHDKSDEDGYEYKSKGSPYLKVGLNYNFLYKSNPDYQLYAGLRACISRVGYDRKNVSVTDPDTQQRQLLDISGEKATAAYGEALAGLQVKLWKHLSAGWSVRARFKFHTWRNQLSKENPYGSDPWFIPGYGTKSHIAATFSLIYTIR